MPRNTGLVQAAEQLRQQHRQAPPKYSEGSMPQPHRMRERAPPYQAPIQSEGSMSSARAAAAASSAAGPALGLDQWVAIQVAQRLVPPPLLRGLCSCRSTSGCG